jgi:hypothetical protein
VDACRGKREKYQTRVGAATLTQENTRGQAGLCLWFMYVSWGISEYIDVAQKVTRGRSPNPRQLRAILTYSNLCETLKNVHQY